MPSSAPNTRQRRSPIRRVASAPVMNTTILLHGPPSRRNMLKSARRPNKRLSALKKSPGSKLPKTRSARRNLIKKFPVAYAARRARADNTYETMRQMYPNAGLRPRGLAGVQAPRPRTPAMSMMALLAMRRSRSKK